MKHLSISILILCACFVPVASGQQPAGKCYNSWAEFHRYNMWRWNRCEKVLNVNNVGGLQQKWKYDTGGEVVVLPNSGERDTLCGLGEFYVLRAECQHWPFALELPHGWPSAVPQRPWRREWFISTRSTEMCTH